MRPGRACYLVLNAISCAPQSEASVRCVGLAEWSIERRQEVGFARPGTKEGRKSDLGGNLIRPARRGAPDMTGYYRLKPRAAAIRRDLAQPPSWIRRTIGDVAVALHKVSSVASRLRQVACEYAFDPISSVPEYLCRNAVQRAELGLIDTKFFRRLDTLAAFNRLFETVQFIELTDPDEHRTGNLRDQIAKGHFKGDFPCRTSPRRRKHCTELDEVENAIEVRCVVAKLSQRALGFGVERLECPLGQRDVQSPRLAGGTICHVFPSPQIRPIRQGSAIIQMPDLGSRLCAPRRPGFATVVRPCTP
jgi:hypothetical protein